MAAMKHFWMAIVFILVLATMAKTWDVAQDDDDEDSLEQPDLRAVERDQLFLEELKSYPHNTKTSLNKLSLILLNETYNI
jgi:hypothetical protein